MDSTFDLTATLATHRGRLCLERCVISGDEDVPVLWLETWASPGRLLASLARPPLVRSWWIAVVLVIPEPVVTTGTARTSVPLLELRELNTCPGHWGFPPDTWTTRHTHKMEIYEHVYYKGCKKMQIDFRQRCVFKQHAVWLGRHLCGGGNAWWFRVDLLQTEAEALQKTTGRGS